MGHRKINSKIKRFAVASAVAACSVSALVLARGHRIQHVAEIPLVIDDAVESLRATSKIRTGLEALGAGPDLSRTSRGKNKSRQRAGFANNGPMLIYANDYGVSL